MSSKKLTIIIFPIAILIALFFIPINNFFAIDSYNGESPSPMMVLESNDNVLKGLKITPLSCNETPSGLTESHFQISNTNESDYEVKVGVAFTDNEVTLYEKQANLKILSGQTINQNHLSDDVYDNPVCVVKIVDWLEI